MQFIKPISSLRRTFINVLVLITSVVIVFVVLELALRVYHLYKYERPLFFSKTGVRQTTYRDNKLGWKMTEGFRFEGQKEDSGGVRYHVKISTNSEGFRQYGSVQSKNPKILIIGDSFTQAMEVSDSKTYYAILADKLKNYEFFTYGCGGYGTLQEFLILDEFMNKIKPQIVIIQECSNDFINNDYHLEKDSFINNNYSRRPYMNLKGKIFYENPAHFYIFQDRFTDYSRLLNFINERVSRLLAMICAKDSVERAIERDGIHHPGFQHSAIITKEIMDKIRQRAHGIAIFTFCVDDLQPYYSEFQKISHEEGFYFIDGIPQSLRRCEKEGLICKYKDKAHWNELGHRIAAQVILNYIKENIPINLF